MATAVSPAEIADLEVAPGYVRSPFLVLIDKAEKAPFCFDGLVARSFIDKSQRTYIVRTERRYLGIGHGDYCLAGYEGRCGIERKSMQDFQGTLLGWRREIADGSGHWTIDVDRRKRFKHELRTLAGFECKAVIVEANLWDCIDNAPQWGVRTASENSKYLLATYLAWQSEFPGVPWIFADGKELAAVIAFRMMEQFWARHAGERRKKKRVQLQLQGTQ